MLRHTQCCIAVVGAGQRAEIEDIAAQLPDLRHVVVRDESYEAWLASFPGTDPDPVIGLDDFCVIRHSAGTTGQSKGIAFSHRAWMNTERNWTFLLPPLELGDHCTHVAPISHGSGYLFVPTWLAGGVNILEPRFEAGRVLDLVASAGGYVFGVPTMIADLVAYARSSAGPRDFASLKAVVVSGAPILPATAQAAREVFGPRLYQLYGQTECVPTAFMGPVEWFGEVPGSEPLRACGRVMPYAELEIRDERNRPLPAGETGEIALRSDGQMVCIWGDPRLTAQRLVDGWVLTGDIGRLDANGFLYLQDRKDDMIISGGFNIWPAELENVIAALPGVREVAVFGVPHPRWGETPVAQVVLEDGAAVTEQDVVEACRQRLGSYKKPASVLLSAQPLARTPLGKVSRKLLREPYWAAAESRIGGT
jgi:acyl-CoA synthetase (AMP-forming)/AMP-acid ligase II